MKVNAKTVYKFTKFTPKSSRPILENIIITPTEIVATDSYKLLRIKTDTGVEKAQLLNVNTFTETYKNVDKTVEVDTVDDKTSEGVYPDYTAIMETKEPVQAVYMSVQLLIDTLEQFKGKGNNVEIAFYEEGGKLTIKGDSEENKNIDALIMPAKKNKNL